MNSTVPAAAAALSHPIADRYLEHLTVERGLSENTLGAYGADISALLSFLDGLGGTLETCSSHDLFLYLTHLRAKKLAAASLARHLSTVRGLFAFAVRAQLLKEDPAALLESPKLPDQLPEFLTRAEMDMRARASASSAAPAASAGTRRSSSARAAAPGTASCSGRNSRRSRSWSHRPSSPPCSNNTCR